MKRSAIVLKALPAALVLATLLTACGDDPAKLVAQAKEFQSKNDNAAAIIQLKNALQAQDSPEARFLLGKSLLLTGDAVGAETELRKALDAGYKADDVVPWLAKAALSQRKFKEVNEFAGRTLSDPKAQAELLTVQAVSWLAQAKVADATRAVEAALKAKPDHAPALIEQARLKARLKDFDGALAVLDQAAKGAEGAEDALKLQGDIQLYGRNDVEAALAVYQASIKAKPDYVTGHAAVVRTLMRQGKMDDAGKALEVLKKVAAGKPDTLYLQAQYAQQNKDIKGARELAQQLLRMSPNSPLAQELAGVVELQSSALVQAEALLAKAVQGGPELAVARRGLVTVYLRTGQLDKALSHLPENINKDDADPLMVSLAGQIYMQKGDFAKAQGFFVRAAKQDPKDPAKRTSVALSRLMATGGNEGLSELQDIASGDSGTVADMALINAHMARRDTPKALKAIDALEKKSPKDPVVGMLRGRTLAMKGDTASARKAFEQALAVKADHFPAIAALAALDMADKKPADAQKRFEAAMQQSPKAVEPVVALAGLKAGQGADKAEVAKLLAKAIDVAPADKGPRMLLIQHHLRTGEAREALTVAQNAVAAIPDNNLDLLDALGLAQLAAKEYNQAVATFGKVAAAQPQSPQPHLRMADVHMANKDSAAAANSLRKALEIKPDLLVAQRGLAGFALQGSKPADAVGIAKDMQKQRPNEAVGYLLEGDIHLSQKDLTKATVAFKTGLDKAANAELAIKYHGVLGASGKKADADKMAADWLKGHPKDVGFMFYLGGRAVATGDLKGAQAQYQRMLDAQPNNAMALNNLAWIAGQQGRPDAIALAEKANQIAPNQPPIMDTWAMLLSAKGEHDKALDIQKKVVAAQPDGAVYKLNLAKIHLAKGDKGTAKGLLTELEALGDKFGGQAEVAKLKQGL